MEIRASKELLDINTKKVRLELDREKLSKRVADYEQQLAALDTILPEAEKAYQDALTNDVREETPASRKACRESKKAWDDMQNKHDEVRDILDASRRVIDGLDTELKQVRIAAGIEVKKVLREGGNHYLHEALRDIKKALPQVIAASKMIYGPTANHEGHIERMLNDRASFDEGMKQVRTIQWEMEHAVHADPKLAENTNVT